MLITLKNNADFIYAYIAFQVVDKESRLDSNGKYLFINGFWIHPTRRKEFRRILDYFIYELFIHPETQQIEEVYWERDNGKIVRKLAYRFIKRLYNGKLISGDKNGKRQNYNRSGNKARATISANC